MLPHFSQNALEGMLLGVNSFQAVLSCLYLAAKDNGGGTFLDVVQVIMVLVQVLFVVCVIGLTSGKLKKVTDALAACFPSSIASEISQAEEAIEEIEDEVANMDEKKAGLSAANGAGGGLQKKEDATWNTQSYVEKQKQKLQRETSKKQEKAGSLSSVRV